MEIRVTLSHYRNNCVVMKEFWFCRDWILIHMKDTCFTILTLQKLKVREQSPPIITFETQNPHPLTDPKQNKPIKKRKIIKISKTRDLKIVIDSDKDVFITTKVVPNYFLLQYFLFWYNYLF